MAILNEPTGFTGDNAAADWSPTKGLRRAVMHGLIAAMCLAVLMGLVVKIAPVLLLQLYLRTAVAFCTAWILFVVVQRAAGMAGWPCTALAVGFTLLVVLSNHVGFALCGVPTRDGVVDGRVWLQPGTLLVCNYIPLIGVVFCAALCHGGGAIVRTVIDVLMINPLTGNR